MKLFTFCPPLLLRGNDYIYSDILEKEEPKLKQEMQYCIASNMKYLRLCYGYSQDALVKKLHMSRTAYGAVERTDHLPQTILLVELAALYHIPLELFFESDKETFVKYVAMVRQVSQNSNIIDLYYNLSPFAQGRLFERAAALLEAEKMKTDK